MNRERLEILKELSDLLEKDRITKDEYEVEKKNLLRPTGWVWDFIQRLSFGFRAISPQIVILILVLLFYNPVKRLVNNASEVGFGDVFAVKVEQALRIGNPDLAKKLAAFLEKSCLHFSTLEPVHMVCRTKMMRNEKFL